MVVVEAGEIIPADGEIVEGAGSVDESAITEQVGTVMPGAWRHRPRGHRQHEAPSQQLHMEVLPGGREWSFLDRMIALVEGAERRKNTRTRSRSTSY